MEGVDTAEVARRLDCEPAGCNDLLEEAHTLAQERALPETQAVGAAKEVMQSAIQSWFLDPNRELEIVDGEPDSTDGPSISITHAVVELVLSDVDHSVAEHILPDLSVLLRRVPKFLELYAPLRLAEDADLVVAKISGERTAGEISSGSPHGEQEVLRLLAALVATGMLEPVPVVTSAADLDILQTELPDIEPSSRRLPMWWIVIAAAVVLVVLGYFGLRMRQTTPEPPVAAPQEGGRWALVVDMGCEPEELQRILRKAREHPKVLQPLAADEESGEPCWRLAWGDFANREAAEAQISEVPASLRREGFDPHAIEVPEKASTDQPELGQD
jgi:hypothetical protein